ncbi:growth inhibitor PemK [Phenylobacterium sp.]|uniref:growth inhibitor PemK n=1 Tax=Phenylobacterium sp. TaxID=1871053 RepID=UPI0025E4C1F4|nr:growth inhibitor PemK [Phenylobacterium sp.]
MVIRYSFLWSHEAAAGAAEGLKDRPCAIVVAAKLADGEIRTIVAPITHLEPEDSEASLELPASVSRTLKLDGERHWLKLDELNRFTWPGYDLRQIPGRDGEYAYGMLPQPIFDALRAKILSRNKAGKSRSLKRD